MDSVNSLENQKLREEIKKLEIENVELKKPFWKTTAFYATFVPLIFSICLNIKQSLQFDAELAQKTKALSIEKEKLEVENDELALKMREYEEGTAITAEGRKKAKEELNEIELAIANTNEHLERYKVTLMMSQSEYERIVSMDKNNPKLKTLKLNIDVDGKTIKHFQEELDGYTARRSELEKIINGK